MTARTPALQALTDAGIAHVVHEYDARSGAAGRDGRHAYGVEAAAALGIAADRMFKTLVAACDGRLVLAIVPVSGELDLRRLAEAFGGRKAVMAELQDGDSLGDMTAIGVDVARGGEEARGARAATNRRRADVGAEGGLGVCGRDRGGVVLRSKGPSRHTASVSRMTAPSPRAGATLARAWRAIWIHMNSSIRSGAAMCRYTISVKKRSDTEAWPRKLRSIGSPKIGSASRNSVVATATTCARASFWPRVWNGTTPRPCAGPGP